jgi:hypothetical protein
LLAAALVFASRENVNGRDVATTTANTESYAGALSLRDEGWLAMTHYAGNIGSAPHRYWLKVFYSELSREIGVESTE